MQIAANPYFGLQNYSHSLKAQDSSAIDKESQNAQSAEEAKQTDANAPEAPNGEKLDPSEQQYVRELAAIDANVRAHEAAHIGAGGGVVSGGATFGYTRGPDGKMYATSGEVPITMKEGRTPEETIQNARQIIAAAMAPADPSPQDYKVAASAAQMEVQAKSEQARERAQEAEERVKGSSEAQKAQEAESQNAGNVADSTSTGADSTSANSTSVDSTSAKNIAASTRADSTNMESQKQSNSYIQYAINSYNANATIHSYIPKLNIAG